MATKSSSNFVAEYGHDTSTDLFQVGNFTIPREVYFASQLVIHPVKLAAQVFNLTSRSIIHGYVTVPLSNQTGCSMSLGGWSTDNIRDCYLLHLI